MKKFLILYAPYPMPFQAEGGFQDAQDKKYIGGPQNKSIRNIIDICSIYLEELGINFPVLLDKKGVISKRYKVTGLRCNYAIDREGFLKFRFLGCSEDTILLKKK